MEREMDRSIKRKEKKKNKRMEKRQRAAEANNLNKKLKILENEKF